MSNTGLHNSKIAKLVHKLKKKKFLFYKEVTIYHFIKEMININKNVNLDLRASALSFNLLMAIPPGLVCILALVYQVPYLYHSFNNELINLIRDTSPDRMTYVNLKNIVQDFSRIFTNNKNAIFSFGLLLTLFFASNVSMSFINTFNSMLSPELKRKKNIVVLRIIALKLTIYLFALFIIAIVLLIAEKNFIQWLANTAHLNNSTTRFILKLLRNSMGILLLLFSVATIYKTAPSSKKKFKLFSFGAIFTTIIFGLLIFAFDWWINNYVPYNQIYGVLGTLVIVMILTYAFAYILLLGFEFNIAITSAKNKYKQDEKNNIK